MSTAIQPVVMFGFDAINRMNYRNCIIIEKQCGDIRYDKIR